MSITQRPFGVTPAGEQVTEYTMTNRDGASVSILDFGGIVTRILVPDRDGKLDDVSLSFDDIDVYAKGLSGSMGMLIGRVGNRIRGASFELEFEGGARNSPDWQYSYSYSNGKRLVTFFHGHCCHLHSAVAVRICLNNGDCFGMFRHQSAYGTQVMAQSIQIYF